MDFDELARGEAGANDVAIDPAGAMALTITIRPVQPSGGRLRQDGGRACGDQRRIAVGATPGVELDVEFVAAVVEDAAP